MKVGDYVRTKDGEFYKVISIKKPKYDIGGADFTYYGELKNNEGKVNFALYEKNYIEIFGETLKYKSSSNIVDLIEVGDILKFKDTKHYQEVEDIDKETLYLTDYIYMCDSQKYKKEIQEELEWVITHEQIESMKYEVKL